jgi:MFS family permease
MHRPTQFAEDISLSAPLVEDAYGVRFWLAYAANVLLMTAVSLQYRYGDFVSSLGGTETTLGLIVGVGMIGSLAMRLGQGVGIDRFGPRQIWLGSVAGIIITVLTHLVIERIDTPAIYLLRIAFQTSLAGAFGASITSISFRAPISRMAEMIGVLGSSGFLGLAMGTQIGDLLAGVPTPGREHVDRLFVASALLACGSFVCVYLATFGETRPPRRRWVPIVSLVRRYHPGTMLLMGLAIGLGVNLPSTFLRPYTAHLGIAKIGLYFGIYAATAFIARIATRRMPERLGLKTTIVLGMSALVVSMFSYLVVRATWHLALPAVIAGFAHALLFPAVVAGASSSFPSRYRGLGIALVLGMFDLGNLIGMPLAGILVGTSRQAGWPEYPTMFLTVAAILSGTTLYFAFVTGRWESARWESASER